MLVVALLLRDEIVIQVLFEILIGHILKVEEVFTSNY